MPFRAEMPTFAGLEIGEELAARIDTAKYRTALRRARNVLGRPAGGVVNRQGFEFVGEIYDSESRCRLLPFAFSIDQTYVLPFEDETSRVVSNGGFVLEVELEVAGITNAAQAVVDAPDHGYAVGDDIYFAGIEGMEEINGHYYRIVAVGDADHVTIDLDTTGFGVFTGSTGGIPGVDQTPPDPDPEPPPYVPVEPPPITFPGFGLGFLPGPGYQWY